MSQPVNRLSKKHLKSDDLCFARRHGAVGFKHKAMLNTISWQQYLTAIFLLSAAWYAYIGLRFYRPAIAARLGLKSPNTTLTPPVQGKLSTVMGKIKPDEGTILADAGELTFGAAASDDVSDETLPPGPGDELLAEAKVLVDAFGSQDDKAEFLSLLRLLVDKYQIVHDEISLPAVMSDLSAYAAERLSFQPEPSEWPAHFNNN
jgi:hypothetical protein